MPTTKLHNSDVLNILCAVDISAFATAGLRHADEVDALVPDMNTEADMHPLPLFDASDLP